MPEGPEVETVKNKLKERILNLKINDIKINYENIIAYPKKENFIKQIIGQTINDIKRKGKWLIFELDNYYLLSHLKMEGKYLIRKKEDIIQKHEHIIFYLNNNTELRYMDTRKFGKMYLIEKDKINEIGPLNKLGLDPELLNYDYLKNKYKNKTIPIKTCLLDQTIILGIGNIYADEILFLSKINPLTKTNLLTKKNINNIIENTKKVLNEAILAGGTTIRSYTSIDNITGKFQNNLLVHGREKEKCYTCQNEIKKIRVNGRGTYYCPICQKEKKW